MSYIEKNIDLAKTRLTMALPTSWELQFFNNREVGNPKIKYIQVKTGRYTAIKATWDTEKMSYTILDGKLSDHFILEYLLVTKIFNYLAIMQSHL